MLESTLKSGQFYAYSMIQLLIEPGLFFKELSGRTSLGRALGFMVICSSFFAIASLFLSNFHVFKPSTPLSLAAYFVKHEETRLDGLLSASLQGVSFQAYVLMGTLMV